MVIKKANLTSNFTESWLIILPSPAKIKDQTDAYSTGKEKIAEQLTQLQVPVLPDNIFSYCRRNPYFCLAR